MLARELVQARTAKNRMYEGKAQLHSVQMQLQNQIGEERTRHILSQNKTDCLRTRKIISGYMYSETSRLTAEQN